MRGKRIFLTDLSGSATSCTQAWSVIWTLIFQVRRNTLARWRCGEGLIHSWWCITSSMWKKKILYILAFYLPNGSLFLFICYQLKEPWWDLSICGDLVSHIFNAWQSCGISEDSQKWIVLICQIWQKYVGGGLVMLENFLSGTANWEWLVVAKWWDDSPVVKHHSQPLCVSAHSADSDCAPPDWLKKMQSVVFFSVFISHLQGWYWNIT